MKKIVLLLFIHHMFYAQITMELEILDNKQEVYREYSLAIKLINESNVDYIIPIDTTGYKVYMEGNKCEDFFLLNTPDVGFEPKIKDEEKILDSFFTYPSRMNSEESLIAMKERKKEEKKEKKTIKYWRRNYQLWKFNDIDVLKNRYIYLNLKTLKSGETIIFSKKFNPLKMNVSGTEGEEYDYYYPIIKEKKYKMHLEFCIDKGKYNYLTPQQKEQYKDYKFFTGKIISNEVEL